MLRNPNHPPSAVFVPRPDGSFRRFNATSGKPMDHQKTGAPNGLFDQNGKLYFGKMPPDMACDAMPSPATTGHGPESPDPEFAYAKHAKGGMLDPSLANAGGQKISVDKANRIWALAKDKISPAELDQLVEMLRPLVDPNLEDEGEQAQDQPPDFVGKPRPGGTMATDSALASFNAEYPEISRISRDTYGMPVPKSRYLKAATAARLALDERTGGESALEVFQREYPEIMKIGRA
jgi:hypothetical protein